ncbi:MAG: hypothetical protein DBY30_04000 [Verrucomicrobia bacterium]|nr:MAG: hypothetical protein DBY30_04000 [Verrucomicrobiota bacterium]
MAMLFFMDMSIWRTESGELGNRPEAMPKIRLFLSVRLRANSAKRNAHNPPRINAFYFRGNKNVVKFKKSMLIRRFRLIPYFFNAFPEPFQNILFFPAGFSAFPPAFFLVPRLRFS